MRILKLIFTVLLLRLTIVHSKLLKYICDPNPDVPNHICRDPYTCRPEDKSINWLIKQNFTEVRNKSGHPYPDDLECPPEFILRDTSPGHIGAKLDSTICYIRRTVFQMFEFLEAGHASLDKILATMEKCVQCSRPRVMAKLDELYQQYLKPMLDTIPVTSEQGGDGKGGDSNAQQGQPGQAGDGTGGDSNAQQGQPGQGGDGTGGDSNAQQGQPGQAGDGKGGDSNAQQGQLGQDGDGTGGDSNAQQGQPGQAGDGTGGDSNAQQGQPGQGGDGEDPDHPGCKRLTKEQVRDFKLAEIESRVYIDVAYHRYTERQEIGKWYHEQAIEKRISSDSPEFDALFQEMKQRQHAVDEKYDEVEKKQGLGNKELDVVVVNDTYTNGKFKDEDYWDC